MSTALLTCSLKSMAPWDYYGARGLRLPALHRQRRRAIRGYLDRAVDCAVTLVVVLLGFPLEEFTPDQRVALAAAPFAVAMLLRLLLGRTQFTRWTIAIG